MRILLALLIPALCAAQSTDLLVGTGKSEDHDLVIPQKMAVEWVFKGEYRIWLTVTYTGSDFKEIGYHPNWTNVISKYKPIVKKLSNGTYEITFTSDLTENLP